MIDLILAAALATLSPAEHADVKCNELAIGILAGKTPAGAMRSTAEAMNLFFVGRLSARNEAMDWNARTIAELKASPMTLDSAKAASPVCLQKMRTTFRQGEAAK